MLEISKKTLITRNNQREHRQRAKVETNPENQLAMKYLIFAASRPYKFVYAKNCTFCSKEFWTQSTNFQLTCPAHATVLPTANFKTESSLFCLLWWTIVIRPLWLGTYQKKKRTNDKMKKCISWHMPDWSVGRGRHDIKITVSLNLIKSVSVPFMQKKTHASVKKKIGYQI